MAADSNDSMQDKGGTFLCSECGARFDSRAALTDHKEQEHGIK